MGCKINAVESYCKVPLANIRLVKLYVPADVDTMPTPGLGVYSAQEPVLATGESYIDIEFDRFSCSLSSNPDTAQPGDYWQHRIQGDIRRNRSELGMWMLRMRNRQFHLLTEDWYGERMWWPYMRLSASRTIEARLNARNGFTFSFARRWQHPGIYLDVNTTDPGIPPSANEEWSDSDGAWSDSDGAWSDFNP